jgi:hypothetical protein
MTVSGGGREQANCLRKDGATDTMKYYLARAVIQEGEYGYGEQFPLAAENGREAEEKVKQYLLDVYGDPDADAFNGGGVLDLFVRIVKFDGVREISKGDYEVLRKYY